MNLETKITIYKFTPQLFTLTPIQDYPIRGRATYLHVRKRKWLDKSSNEIFSYDWDLSEFDGTRLNSEFVSFLKEGD